MSEGQRVAGLRTFVLNLINFGEKSSHGWGDFLNKRTAMGIAACRSGRVGSLKRGE
jgi:hypothetical protein